MFSRTRQANYARNMGTGKNGKIKNFRENAKMSPEGKVKKAEEH